jgi:hypothetical protein
MVTFHKFLYIIALILIIISSTNEDAIDIIVTAKTGIINKKLESSKTQLSFKINCEVNKNITNNITKIDILIKVKKPNDEKVYDSICNLVPVRLIEEETALTNIYCIIDLERPSELNEEVNLIIANGPTEGNSDFSAFANFIFTNFDKISEVIEIGDLTLEYMEEDYCKNNNFLFEIISGNIEIIPLQSTICSVSLANDESHKIAKCAIPVSGNKIKCFVDVSETKYVENNNITILAQDLVSCENGQHLRIVNDAINKLIIKEECGELVNNDNQGNFLKEFFYLFFLLILF